MLYSKVAPKGFVITIVPVGTVHVGCTVTVAVGTAGGAGTAFTVKLSPFDTQPLLVFLAVTV
jgi:hypothetical protein